MQLTAANSLRSRPNPIPRETNGTGTQLGKLCHTRQARTLATASGEFLGGHQAYDCLYPSTSSKWMRYSNDKLHMSDSTIQSDAILCTSKMSTKLSATREWSQGTERMPTISVQNGYLKFNPMLGRPTSDIIFPALIDMKGGPLNSPSKFCA